MLISLFLGLPIVSIAIFGTGLWLGHAWLSPTVPRDTSPSADRISATHVPIAAALQQHAPAPSLTSISPSNSVPAHHETEENTGDMPGGPSPLLTPHTATTSGEASVAPPPSEPVADSVQPPMLPSDLWPARFEPDVEGWQVVRDSQNPEDMVDFLAAFPASRFAAEARARLRQLQREPVSPSVTPLQVRYAQMSLRLAGFDPGPLDGVCGPRTLVALRQYQASHDLPVTGTLDATTQQALQIPPHAALEAWQRARRNGHRAPVTAGQVHEHLPQAQPRHDPPAWGPQAESEF